MIEILCCIFHTRMALNSMNKIGKFMRILLLYDLPSVTNKDKKIYKEFVKFLITEGFVRIQESVFVKACLNANAVKTCKNRIRQNSPIKGSIRLFVLTEENYQRGENINNNYSFSELIQTTDYYIQIGDEIDYDED